MNFIASFVFTTCAFFLSLSQALDCPAIEGCSCSSGEVRCEGLKDLPPPLLLAGFEYIHFQHCQFPALDKLEYTDAETLFIRSSIVASISDNAFESMKALTLLDLTSNELREVTPDMFNGLDSLATLNLANNDLIKTEEKAFDNLPKLQNLMLSLNKNIKLDNNTFLEHPALTHLSLIDCGLTEVPVAPLSKVNLVMLNLDRNNFGTIPTGTFSTLSSLEELHLDSCQLTEVSEDLFDDLKALKLVDLGANSLQEIPEDAFEESKGTIRAFYVESNQLKTLPGDLLEWGSLEHVMLGHNPWVCDCDLTWMTEMDLARIDKENVTCAAPEEFEKLLLSNLTSEDLCPCTDDCDGGGGGSSAVALAIAIPIVIVCAILIGYYLYKIIQGRRARADQKSGVRYSAVYKDTTEATPKGSGSQSPGGGAPTSVL